MTLTTHAVAGSLIGALVYSNPALAAVLGFSSHFLLDAVPHWDYRLASSNEDKANPMNSDISVKGKAFIFDLVKIGFDLALGLLIICLLFWEAPSMMLISALIGGIFAVLPDPLQFLYMKYRHEPLLSLQRFHLFMHAKTHLKDRPVIGVSLQVFLILVIAIATKFII